MLVEKVHVLDHHQAGGLCRSAKKSVQDTGGHKTDMILSNSAVYTAVRVGAYVLKSGATRNVSVAALRAILEDIPAAQRTANTTDKSNIQTA